MFGPSSSGRSASSRTLWDPDGLMNPGKVVDPYPLDSNIRFSTITEPVSLRPTGYSFDKDDGSLMHASMRCVGVGRCRRDDAATMCPSYRATRDEVHSTCGRAKVLAEMFQADLTPASWRNPEVREALDLCLSCKACASDCPTKVDMATYKSEFYSHYYKGRLRPAAMLRHGPAPWAGAGRNGMAGYLPARQCIAPCTRAWNGPQANCRHYDRAPRAAFSLRVEGSGAVRTRPAAGCDRAPARARCHLARYFHRCVQPRRGADLVEAFSVMGERVAVPSAWACCGRTLYDFGMLDGAKRTLRRLVAVLEPWARAGIPWWYPSRVASSPFATSFLPCCRTTRVRRGWRRLLAAPRSTSSRLGSWTVSAMTARAGLGGRLSTLIATSVP